MTNEATIPTVSVDEVASNQEWVLVDVREDDEWRAGHAPNARHLPMSRLAEFDVDSFADGVVAVICRSGNRSEQVTRALRSYGIDARNVAGGMNDWVAVGHPVVTD